MISRSMKTFVASGTIAFLLGCVPAAAQVFHPETATLDNGLRIVVVPNHRAPVVTHMVWLRAGAIDETWGKSGIAHFLEHLMFKGTPRYPEGEYSRLIASMGGEENAFTSQDYTAYYATLGKEYLPKIMELEADRFAHWQVNDEQVARERDVILKERQQVTENNPVAAFFEEVNAILYPNYPYQRPVIGWRAEMKDLQRKDAEAFVNTYYVASNAVLVISGDTTLKEVLPLAKKYYGVLPKKPVPERKLGVPVQLNSARRIEKESALVRETVWSRHRVLNPARPETIAESDAVQVLQRILGDGRVGRLYRRLVVEDKLATSASITYDPVSYGPVRFSVVVVPAPTVDLAKIERAVDDEIARILKNGVTEKEVENATRGMEIAAVYARDSVYGPASVMGEALVSGLDVETVEAWPSRMRAIRKQAVDNAAQNVFKRGKAWVTAVIRPAQEEKGAK